MFTLHRGIAVEGVVVSSDESPVEGASVGIGPNRQQDNAIPAQTTDASGKFSYAFEPGKEVVLTVRAKHYAPAMLRFTMGQEKKYATIKLSAAHWIGGKVVDTSARRFLMRHYFWKAGGNHSLREFLPTNAQGEFRWTEAPADAVTFYVSAKGLRDTTQELTPDHEQIVTLGSPVDLKLKPTPATQP